MAIMKNTQKFLVIVIFVFGTGLFASPVGLGIQLGEPTGVHLRLNHAPNQFLHFTLGGSFVDGGLSTGADYLFQIPVKSQNVKDFRFYGGPGILLQNRVKKDKDKNSSEDFGLQFGPNGRLGAEYFIPKTDFSVYLDINLHLFIIPSVRLGGGFVIGGSYWLK